MRKIFVLFASVFALVTTATATVVTTAMKSDTSGLAPAAHIEAVEKMLEPDSACCGAESSTWSA